jgi:acyl-coenzyme A thioesterase PaaI-like protein
MRVDNLPEGWAPWAEATFNSHVGGFYCREGGGANEYGFLADERHGNTRGVVHGGVFGVVFDTALGLAGREASGQLPSATVQLSLNFVDALRIHEFAIIRCEVVRATRSLIFVRGVMTAQDRVIATADGVWKILREKQIRASGLSSASQANPA